MPHKNAHQSVIRVADARGFVVEGDGDRYVITAAHCLQKRPNDGQDWEPYLPPTMSYSYTEERTYPKLLGSLGSQPTVWAECLFVDPVADIAVLGKPDDQELGERAEEYVSLVEEAKPVKMRSCRERKESGWLFALDAQHWFRCKVSGTRKTWLWEAEEPIRGGMSGSPILAADGKVIAVCCTSNGSEDTETHTEGGPNPGLVNLPGWLVEELT